MEGKEKSAKGKKKDIKLPKFSQILFEFCQETSGHGIQYWVSARSTVEKVSWVIVVLIGFVTASMMVSN